MDQLQIYLKVMIDPDVSNDRPERLAAELCRQVQKVFGVKSAEVTNIIDER